MRPHILVVDDEASIRDLLRELLTRAGYRVSAFTTAEDALRAVTEDRPQLVITDLQLEESDGFELAERISAIAPGVPVVLLTGIIFDRDALQASAGKKIAGYIEKTAPLSHILEEVKRLAAPA